MFTRVGLLILLVGCVETIGDPRTDAGSADADALDTGREEDDAWGWLDAGIDAESPDLGGVDASIDMGSSMDAGTDSGTDGGTDAGPTRCTDPGCDWCASKDVCNPDDGCAYDGRVGATRCTSRFDPCGVASCWEPTLSIAACRDRTQTEDFSSGRYSVHRYEATLPGGEPVTISLSRTAGTYQPALLISDRAGGLIFAGDPVSLHDDIRVLAGMSGRAGSASVTLQAAASTPIYVHVSGWAAADDAFETGLSTSARYSLRTMQMCEGGGGSESESVGSTNSGSLVNGVRIGPGAGYVVADTGRDGYWGTQEVIDDIASGYAAVVARHPDAAVVQVRDISVERGGRPAGSWPHSSHRSGRDADMTYHLDSCSATTGCPLRDVNLAEFDAEATWTLFEHWLRADVVTYIFVDTSLQRVLRDVARARGATDAELERWFQYPRAAGTAGLIRMVPNHLNHLHVRFRCADDDDRCIE